MNRNTPPIEHTTFRVNELPDVPRAGAYTSDGGLQPLLPKSSADQEKGSPDGVRLAAVSEVIGNCALELDSADTRSTQQQ